MFNLLVLVFLASLANTGVSTGPGVVPDFQYILQDGSTNIGCQFDAPLTDCRVRVWETNYIDTEMDFGRGRDSPTVPVNYTRDGQTRMVASFTGSGLASGHCGVHLAGVRNGQYVVQCRGRSEAGWSTGFSLLATDAYQPVPSSTTTPRFVVAGLRTDVSVQVTVQGGLDRCSIYTPTAGGVHFTPDESPSSDSRYKFSFLGDLWSVTLPNVTEADAGVWAWLGRQGNKWAYQMTVVAIAAPPTGVPQLVVNDESKLLAGQNVTATCWTTPSVPPANVTWLLGGKVIRADAWNATLDEDTARTALPWQPQPARQTLSRLLTSSDHGKRLKCRVDHVALSGPRTSSGVVLQLNHVPVVTVEKAVVRSAEGHFTELACLVDARPQATVQWKRGATAVATSHLVIMGREEARHWLRLEDPDEHDLAAFTCTAKNVAGSTAKIITVTGAPGQPEWAGNVLASQLAWTVESYVDLTDTTLKIRRGKAVWKTVRALVTARLNVSTLLVSHEFQPAGTGNHQAFIRVANEYGRSDTSAFHSFSADLSHVTHTTPPPVIPTVPVTECGKLNLAKPQVARGRDAVVGQFPWHAGIYKQQGKGFIHQCGGSLVSPRLVISAAHCFYDDNAEALNNASLYRVTLGTIAYAWDSTRGGSTVQRFMVLNFTITEFYNGAESHFAHDIAVVRLAKDAVITHNVGFVCLDWNHVYKQAGDKAMVADWGATEQASSSDTLQWVELPFVSKATCRAHLRTLDKRRFFTVDKFCAGFVNQTTSVCSGDSGGGLVARNSTTDRYSLVGIVSISFEPIESTAVCQAELYTGFTAVSEHAQWLRTVLVD